MVIDLNIFAEFRDSMGADFIGEIVEVFNEDAPELFRQMHAALESDDADLLRRSAHSLKSNSAAFGAMGLTELARGLEMQGKEGRLDGAADNIARAEAAYQQVRQLLAELIQT